MQYAPLFIYSLVYAQHTNGINPCLLQLSELELPVHVRVSILTHKSCKFVEQAAQVCIDALCEERKFDLVVKVVERLMGLVYSPRIEWAAIRDLALIHCASER